MITLIKIFITFLAMAKKSMLLVDNIKYYQKNITTTVTNKYCWA